VRSQPLLLLLIALAGAFPAGARTPRLEPGAEGRLFLTELPEILGDDEVREHLGTGLTTTFVLRVTARDRTGERITGGARVEARYELWDEVYHLTALGVDGRLHRHTATSFEELEAWWRELRLAVLEPPAAGLVGAPPPRLTLEVVPFSQAELDDTERWFTDSLDRAGRSSAEEVAQSAEDRPDRLGRLFNLLMATSIQRRSVRSYHFDLPVPPAPEDGG
jgi:hypothetical protein